jgi:hypothetical protein
MNRMLCSPRGEQKDNLIIAELGLCTHRLQLSLFVILSVAEGISRRLQAAMRSFAALRTTTLFIRDLDEVLERVAERRVRLSATSRRRALCSANAASAR